MRRILAALGLRAECRSVRPPGVALVLLALALPGEAATPMTAAGTSHSLALHADGTVRAWGNDAEGQLGVGAVLASTTPLHVAALPPIRPGPASIAASSHALAIAADGRVWSWGSNFSGQLGDGTLTNRSTPVPVLGVTDAVAVAAGGSLSFAVTASGDLWSWGTTPGGRRPTPSHLASFPARAAAVSAGQGHGIVVDRDGLVWALGNNDAGQLGDGTTTTPQVPVRVAGLSGVLAISSGPYHNLALRSDGTVWAWGLNDFGQLGDGTTTNRLVPVQVRDLSGVAGIHANGEPASYAVTADGRLWRWGARPGPPAPTPGPIAQLVAGHEQTRQVAAGASVVVALRGDGTVWTQGMTGAPALGHTGNGVQPAPVPGLSGVSGIAVGASVYAVLADGRVFSWGSNANGTLGTGRALNRTTPGRMLAVDSAVQVGAGGATLVLRANGTVLTIGGLFAQVATPVPLEGLDGVVQVAAGNLHGAALRSDGTVWTWGDNNLGQLGRGHPATSYDGRPAPVPNLSGVIRIAASEHRTMAVRSDGTVWAWGRNFENTLGVAATATCRWSLTDYPCVPQPARVPGIDNVVDIATSASHTLALRADRGVWAWGHNFTGALGDDTTGNTRSSPAPVVVLSDVQQVAAGGTGQNPASMALKRDGTVWTWGGSPRGQLGGEGSGRTPSGGAFRQRPGLVEALTGIRHISAGGAHLFALRSDGVLFGWGGNERGQVGDGTVADQFRPAIVLREEGAGTFEGGDWFLDLDPGVGATVAVDKAFKLVAEGSVGETEASVSAQIRVRAADAGRTGNVYVFALAPQNRVLAAADGAQPLAFKAGARGKDLPVSCVLAQLNASGQLQAVSAASLQAYVSGALSGQDQGVSILSGVPVANIAGATFFVGYGTSGTSMLNGGTNRSAATAPAPTSVECRPEPPKTGWWWNAAEDGRGYSIERRGNNLFFAAFLYDVSGRSTWLVSSGPVSLDGALFTGDLLEVRGGQTLGGAYPGFPSNVRSLGPVTLAFNSASEGTMVWPGGNVPIRRFDIVPNGLATGPAPSMPEGGWWWNEQESGRGFFMEWQGNMLDVAGYMYDDAGNPVWYITVGPTSADGRTFSGTWWSYGSGMTLMGPWRPHVRVNDNVAPVTITFTSATTATMTLPNGRTTSLVRHRF